MFHYLNSFHLLAPLHLFYWIWKTFCMNYSWEGFLSTIVIVSCLTTAASSKSPSLQWPLHSVASTEDGLSRNCGYRRASQLQECEQQSRVNYTDWLHCLVHGDHNGWVQPFGITYVQGPSFEIGYIPGDLRGSNYDKVNLFLEKTTCISCIVFLITEGIVAPDKFVLLELPVKNLRLFRHVGGHGSDFFDRDCMSLTWAVHAGAVYYLDATEKSLQRVSYMTIKDDIGSILDRLSWSNGYAWDYWWSCLLSYSTWLHTMRLELMNVKATCSTGTWWPTLGYMPLLCLELLQTRTCRNWSATWAWGSSVLTKQWIVWGDLLNWLLSTPQTCRLTRQSCIEQLQEFMSRWHHMSPTTGRTTAGNSPNKLQA